MVLISKITVNVDDLDNNCSPVFVSVVTCVCGGLW